MTSVTTAPPDTGLRVQQLTPLLKQLRFSTTLSTD